jgi:hypothetical protein
VATGGDAGSVTKLAAEVAGLQCWLVEGHAIDLPNSFQGPADRLRSLCCHSIFFLWDDFSLYLDLFEFTEPDEMIAVAGPWGMASSAEV